MRLVHSDLAGLSLCPHHRALSLFVTEHFLTSLFFVDSGYPNAPSSSAVNRRADFLRCLDPVDGCEHQEAQLPIELAGPHYPVEDCAFMKKSSPHLK